jgi:hypothetical protein
MSAATSAKCVERRQRKTATLVSFCYFCGQTTSDLLAETPDEGITCHDHHCRSTGMLTPGSILFNGAQSDKPLSRRTITG